MQKTMEPRLRHELAASAHVFASAVREVFETMVMEDIRRANLTYPHLKLLYMAARTEGHTIGDAATFLKVSYAAGSKTVDKLVRRRLLRRTRNEKDRRASRLSVTAAGRRLIEDYEASRHKMEARLFDRLSAHELRATSKLLDRLAAAIVGCGGPSDGICLQCEIYYRRHCRFEALSGRTCFYRPDKLAGQAAVGPGGRPDRSRR